MSSICWSLCGGLELEAARRWLFVKGDGVVELLLKETKTDDLGRFTSHRCRHDLKRILRYAVGIVAVG